jgi:hypothetical protein
MRFGILSFAALALGGCSLLLGTDDLAGTDGVAGQGDASGDAATGDAASPTSEGGSTADAGAGKRKLGPLVYVESADSRKARVDGFFELTFPVAKNNLLSDWVDLANGGVTNVGGVPVLYDAPRADVNGTWCDGSNGSSSGVVDFYDATPVLVAFSTFVHHLLDNGVDVKRWARYTVHATGRISVELSLANGGTAAFTASQWTYHDVQLSSQVGWDRMELASKSAYAFFPKNGGTSLTIINQAAEVSTAGGDNEVRWTMPSANLAQGASLDKLGEIQLGATVGDVADRVNDVRNPAVEVFQGGNAAASTYVLSKGQYYIPATSGTLKFGLGPTRARYYPTFAIDNFPYPSDTWKLSLDGVVIASAQNPVNDRVIAKHLSDNALIFAYLDVIPANAPPEKRTFVLER